MKMFCLFAPHVWRHVGNVFPPTPNEGDGWGLYQCKRCKELSQGNTRPFDPYDAEAHAAAYPGY